MIQRKQTLFLLAACALIISNLFYPFVNSNNIVFDAFSVKSTVEPVQSFTAVPVAIYLILLFIINFFTIFLFKSRLVQMRFTILSIILCVGFYGLLIFYHFWIKKHFTIELSQYSFALVSTLIAAIFDFMAFSSIGKDEKLVRDSDRLR